MVKFKASESLPSQPLENPNLLMGKESVPEKNPAPSIKKVAIERLFSHAKRGEGNPLVKLRILAKGGNQNALEALYALLVDRVPGSFEAFSSLAFDKECNETAGELFWGYLRSFVKRHWGHLAAKDIADPSDLAQTVIRRAMENGEELKGLPGAKFLAYLKRMARNWTVDRLREKKKRKEKPYEEAPLEGTSRPAPPDPRPLPEEVSDLDFMTRISQLDKGDQDLLVMRYKHDFTYKEIGERLSPPLKRDAVRMRIARILKQLGESIEKGV